MLPLSTTTLTFTRYTGGAYTDGDFAPGASTTFEARGSLQPMDRRERQKFEEGRRIKARYFFYTKDELRVDESEGAKQADRTDLDGKTLVVVGVEDWMNQLPNSIVSHREYVLAELEV